jgi:hypothetical protein
LILYGIIVVGYSQWNSSNGAENGIPANGIPANGADQWQ